MKGQMRQADRTGAGRAVILEGDDVRIRNMGSGEQREVKADRVLEELTSG
jgi:histidyl-tRNA synthetase